ncbi:fused MFS/spermidine synthase [Massilia sp. 9096]|uniref:fused MFS/spermidine synthase n=1 Tax=Massilia sp. 9096 TaxID=1500894 RepID=UPI0012E07931|nr:fused MFS/spermidine synthase [Massilia sp. 9096]
MPSRRPAPPAAPSGPLSVSSRPAAPLVRTRGNRRTLEFAPGDIQAEMLLSRPHALALAYTRAMMCFALFAPDPRHIVMVGLGGGSLAKFCHRHFPRARITVLELRADVIALRDQFRVPPDDGRFQVVHADAAHWLARMPQLADVLLLDGFDEDGLPEALANPGFYHDCRRVLRDGGVLVANVFTYDPRYRGVLEDLARVFDGRTCWIGKAAGNNRIVYALKSPPADGRASRLQRLLARRPGLGLGPLDALAVRAVLAWIAARSVFTRPQ